MNDKLDVVMLAIGALIFLAALACLTVVAVTAIAVVIEILRWL